MTHSIDRAVAAEYHNAPEGVPLEQSTLPPVGITEENMDYACAIVTKREAGESVSEAEEDFVDELTQRLDKHIVENLSFLIPRDIRETRARLAESSD